MGRVAGTATNRRTSSGYSGAPEGGRGGAIDGHSHTYAFCILLGQLEAAARGGRRSNDPASPPFRDRIRGVRREGCEDFHDRQARPPARGRRSSGLPSRAFDARVPEASPSHGDRLFRARCDSQRHRTVRTAHQGGLLERSGRRRRSSDSQRRRAAAERLPDLGMRLRRTCVYRSNVAGFRCFRSGRCRTGLSIPRTKVRRRGSPGAFGTIVDSG